MQRLKGRLSGVGFGQLKRWTTDLNSFYGWIDDVFVSIILFRPSFFGQFFRLGWKKTYIANLWWNLNKMHLVVFTSKALTFSSAVCFIRLVAPQNIKPLRDFRTPTVAPPMVEVPAEGWTPKWVWSIWMAVWLNQWCLLRGSGYLVTG